MTEIVQIVPYLPPSISGVGDYALLLAGQWRRAHDIRTKFVVGHPNGRGLGAKAGTELDGFPVLQLKDRSAEELLRALAQPGSPATVILQYVGYGYEKRGCPFWLANALREWQGNEGTSGHRTRRLITMFHELYAPGPIWTSSFWNWPLQRWLVARIARLSSFCFSNRQQSADRLERMAPGHAGNIPAFPVFSNFGEPSEILPLSERLPQAVFFGCFGRGIRSQDEGWKAIVRASAHLGIQKLVTVGSEAPELPSRQIKVESHAALSPADASRLLSSSRIGFLDYFNGYLGKSGIFAAFCSHGMLPVLLLPNSSELDGLGEDGQFLAASSLEQPVSAAQQQPIADAALHWYRTHDLATTASCFANTIRAPLMVC